MNTLEEIYDRPGPMTSAGKYAGWLGTLPRELPALVRAIQGIQIHEQLVRLYGVTVPESRTPEVHLRRLEHMLGAMHARDSRPLAETRKPDQRAIGVCRHFTVLLVGALRAQGHRVRARVGFASYFNPPQYEDHWVGEYWNTAQKRWILVDAQLDEVQRKAMKIDFDPLDVPHDRFVIAHDAWTRTRRGEIEDKRFGFSPLSLTGSWFIASSLVRDAAALNGIEVLPWDVWSGMAQPNLDITPEQLAYYDRLAKLTAAPDEHARELRQLFETDAKLRPGPSVWNDRAQAQESIDVPPAGVPLD